MSRSSRLCGLLVLSICTLAGAAARAEHAKIQLDVQAKGKPGVTAFVDQTPPDWGKNPRPVVKLAPGTPIKVQWVLTNVYPHKTLENVVVHAYVVKQGKAGQREVPELGEEVELETAYEIDLKPGAKSGARFTLRLDEPGAYLLRVETRGTDSDHEHFAAVDLVVEE